MDPEPLNTDETELSENSDIDIQSNENASEECVDSQRAQVVTQANRDGKYEQCCMVCVIVTLLSL